MMPEKPQHVTGGGGNRLCRPTGTLGGDRPPGSADNHSRGEFSHSLLEFCNVGFGWFSNQAFGKLRP